VITEITDKRGAIAAYSASSSSSRSLRALLVPATLATCTLTIPLQPWVRMWLIAFSIFIAAKWLSWTRFTAANRTTRARTFLYFALWPGMDPAPFAAPELSRRANHLPTSASLTLAIANLLAGAILILLAAFASHRTPLTGWVGMVGFVLALHFGLFGLIAAALQTSGLPVEPIMRAPILAQSVAEFWGARWNTAFSYLARTFILRPLGRRIGVNRGLLIVFLVSGLVHEAVISLPAGGGFGLPTGYFLLQGFSCILERSAIGRRIGLEQGLRGRLFTFAAVASPAFWLFHPAFVRNVFLPMLRIHGAG
jgi:hypothetical protein